MLVRTLLPLILVIWPALAWAHAFPDHSEPRVGHTVDPPPSVRVWFDGALEPVFSTIRVEFTDALLTEAGFKNIQFRGAGRLPGLWMTMIAMAGKSG